MHNVCCAKRFGGLDREEVRGRIVYLILSVIVGTILKNNYFGNTLRCHVPSSPLKCLKRKSIISVQGINAQSFHFLIWDILYGSLVLLLYALSMITLLRMELNYFCAVLKLDRRPVILFFLHTFNVEIIQHPIDRSRTAVGGKIAEAANLSNEFFYHVLIKIRLIFAFTVRSCVGCPTNFQITHASPNLLLALFSSQESRKRDYKYGSTDRVRRDGAARCLKYTTVLQALPRIVLCVKFSVQSFRNPLPEDEVLFHRSGYNSEATKLPRFPTTRR